MCGIKVRNRYHGQLFYLYRCLLGVAASEARTHSLACVVDAAAKSIVDARDDAAREADDASAVNLLQASTALIVLALLLHRILLRGVARHVSEEISVRTQEILPNP